MPDPTTPSPTPQDDDLEFSHRQWYYRRAVAFTSLWASIIFTFILFVLVAIFGPAAQRLTDFQVFFATTVSGWLALAGAYMGLATWSDVKLPMDMPSQRGDYSDDQEDDYPRRRRRRRPDDSSDQSADDGAPVDDPDTSDSNKPGEITGAG